MDQQSPTTKLHGAQSASFDLYLNWPLQLAIYFLFLSLQNSDPFKNHLLLYAIMLSTIVFAYPKSDYNAAHPSYHLQTTNTSYEIHFHIQLQTFDKDFKAQLMHYFDHVVFNQHQLNHKFPYWISYNSIIFNLI